WLSFVAASRGSTPANAPNKIAASVTVRAIGPAVSWLCAIGTIPARLIKPTVGLIPTSPFAEEGQTTDPSVSVPTATTHRFAAAAPEPELEPHGLRSSEYGSFVWPPRPLHPLEEWLDRMFAHSLKFVLPRITAPASRNFFATPESCGGGGPTSASDPAVVIIL